MQLKEIAVSSINPPAAAIRSVVDEDKFADLVQSISDLGVIQPIRLKPDGDRFQIVAGHRRFLAATSLNLKKIPAIIEELDDLAAEKMKIDENLIREDVNPIDLAYYYADLKERFNLTDEKMGEMIGRGKTIVSRIRNLVNLPDNLQAAVREGKIHWTSATELNRIDNESVRDYYLHIAVENGATQPVVTKWVHEYLKSKQTPQSAQEFEDSPADVDVIRAQVIADRYKCFACGAGPKEAPLDMVHVCYSCKAALEAELRRNS